jgi:hypothetical protein
MHGDVRNVSKTSPKITLKNLNGMIILSLVEYLFVVYLTTR